ncbi:MAG: universal stress protein [Limnochordales bacterium]
MFERVLVALDGSENAWKALKHAVEVAKGVGAKRIGLVHVRPSLDTLAYAYGYETVGMPGWSFAERLNEGIRQAEQRSLELLREAERYVREQGLTGVEVVLHPEEGPVVRRIIDTARRDGYDLLVLGSRGMGRAAGLLLGSVSQSVAANLPCSVLIVDSRTREERAQRPGSGEGARTEVSAGRGGSGEAGAGHGA